MSSGGHRPVMLEEVAETLAPAEHGRYVDATLGGGSMAEMILERSSPDGALLGLDRDQTAVDGAGQRLARFGPRFRPVQASFDRLGDIMAECGWGDGVDGVLADLGLSSLQLDDPARGFSFMREGPLDMRMDQGQALSAATLIAGNDEQGLARLLRVYGEERAGKRIARRIIERRDSGRMETTGDLRQAVLEAGLRGRPGHDPATRTFQALRIAANEELAQLEAFLDEGWQLLAPGGRMVVISYHSLEDRLVKQAFRRWAADCMCPPEQPVCNCGWTAKVRLLGRRKRKPTETEVEANPRARSAGLRAVVRLED